MINIIIKFYILFFNNQKVTINIDDNDYTFIYLIKIIIKKIITPQSLELFYHFFFTYF